MEFKDIVAVSGKPGLYEMLNARPDGLIIKPLGGGRSQFASNRIHTFSPLDKISIYVTTEEESVELGTVIYNIKLYEEAGNTIPNPKKANKADLDAFFREILADYDDEKVYISDIKKIIKWFYTLKEYDLIPEQSIEEGEIEDTSNADAEDIEEATTNETKEDID